VAYRLELPETMSIHNVFHVGLLKKYRFGSNYIPPPIPLEIEGELEFEVDHIVTHREKKVCSRNKKITQMEYFVNWVGYGVEHSTWEPEAHLKNAPECIIEYWRHHDEVEKARLARPRQTVKRSKPSAPTSSQKKRR